MSTAIKSDPNITMDSPEGSSPEGAREITVSGRTLNEKEQSEFFGVILDKSDLGASGSLRYKILTTVLGEKYDPAINELKDYLGQESPYPDFHRRIKPQVGYCIDLIYAIRAKRNFPGFNSLTRSKQQELREKFKEHFEELKRALKKIESILIDLRVGDSRSTIIVIKTAWYAVVSIFAMAVFIDLTHGGVLLTTWNVINQILQELYDMLFTI